MNKTKLRDSIDKFCMYLTLMSFIPLFLLFVYIIAFVGYHLVVGFLGGIQESLILKWTVFSLICGLFPLIIAIINDRYRNK